MVAIVAGHLPREVSSWQQRRDDVGAVPASEHHQPGPHLRDAVAELVLHGAPRFLAVRGVRHRADRKPPFNSTVMDAYRMDRS